VDAKLAQIALEQRRIPSRTVRRAVAAIGKRGALLIGIGVMIGQVLGGAATPIVQKIITTLFGAH
jgi:hypothetical protein